MAWWQKKFPTLTQPGDHFKSRFFSKCLVPVIVFLLDRDLRCSLKLLLPLIQCAYQSPKLHIPPLRFPLASSPAPHVIPSSWCRHHLEPPTLSAVTTAVFWLLSERTSVDIPQDLLHLLNDSNRPHRAKYLLYSDAWFHLQKITLAVSSILNICDWLRGCLVL